MTIEEYCEKNNLSYEELGEIVGYSKGYIVKNRSIVMRVNNEEGANRFRKLGIDVEVFARGKRCANPIEREYLAQEILQIGREAEGEIYCYTEKKINELTKYLNRRKICYYVRTKKDYWIVKYDRRLREELIQ